jgi:hypothetical protein
MVTNLYFCTMMLRLCFYILSSCCVWPGLLAQSMVISEPLSIRNDFGYELIGRLRDRFLVFRDQVDEFEIQAYDSQLRLSWNKKLEDLENKGGTQILKVVSGKNDFSIIYKIRKKGTSIVRIHKYDPGGNLIDTMTIKNYGDRIFNTPILDAIVSEDRNTIAIYNTAERTALEMTCFRVDKMQKAWDKALLVEDYFIDESLRDLLLTNDGRLFVVSETNNKRGKLDDHNFQALEIGSSGERLRYIPVHSFLSNDVAFTYDNLNNRLVGAGLYSEKPTGRSIGTFFISVDPSDTTKNVIRFEPFDDKTASVLRGKDVESDNKGVTDAFVRQLVLRRDGGVLMVAERHHEIQRGAATGRGLLRDGVRMVVDFYYDDVIMAAINPDGSCHWRTVLHKKQYSQDDNAVFSSFFILKNLDKLHVMFNDEVKYENTCSDYVVSTAGKFDRNSLLSTDGQDLRLRFRDALQVNTSECIIPSEFRSKLRLVWLKL